MNAVLPRVAWFTLLKKRRMEENIFNLGSLYRTFWKYLLTPPPGPPVDTLDIEIMINDK